METQGSRHHVTSYRRRDLRNSLESRLGMERDRRNVPTEPPKKRVKIKDIPLSVSDFTIEDLIKASNDDTDPVYIKFYDNKESRTCIFELTDKGKMESFVQHYNNHQLDDALLQVEIFEQHRKPNRPKSHGSYGSHYNRSQHGRPSNSGRRGVANKTKEKPKSIEDLDAELDAYMKS
ncbi:hypothetical protein KAFR_0E00170 [Kazachstania africana CBS 2517]|uniref:Chromatin target of PRMT1 protein C-terminal domain-containing protein n=1 Tax=Kazachstania africana (strain ATCC 22294 / BCRC 22015 / CBS 2517 / CECT 1963 / NBRC 1671 / NRRL Y-8276) TaxID=1071382 RepID=H2AUX1_KAZAF|nr:hypothetical protein KAFR_0E00170 [Kazachstania africana CBS 2517]CCF58171.1 hypothetical protein KAFR_0E00170 [Kazachstania africana CBS 2517]